MRHSKYTKMRNEKYVERKKTSDLKISETLHQKSSNKNIQRLK